MALIPYITIRDMEFDELVEVPAERDGTLLLSTVKGQCPSAVGIRFKTESGAWRGLRTEGNIIKQPAEGWGEIEYHVVRKKLLKREASETQGGPLAKLSKMTEEELLSDIIVSGMPYATTQDEMEEHFSQYGELEMCRMKYDKSNGMSRGFGFIRYKTVEAVEKAFLATHLFNKRRVSIAFSKSLEEDDGGNIPTKLFVGRLPQGTTAEDVKEYFSRFGVLKDVYLPNPFRGYGFVMFANQHVANKVISETHVLNGTYLNVGTPTSKREGFDNTHPVSMRPRGDDMMGNQHANKNRGGNPTHPNLTGPMGALAAMMTKIQGGGGGGGPSNRNGGYGGDFGNQGGGRFN